MQIAAASDVVPGEFAMIIDVVEKELLRFGLRNQSIDAMRLWFIYFEDIYAGYCRGILHLSIIGL